MTGLNVTFRTFPKIIGSFICCDAFLSFCFIPFFASCTKHHDYNCLLEETTPREHKSSQIQMLHTEARLRHETLLSYNTRNPWHSPDGTQRLVSLLALTPGVYGPCCEDCGSHLPSVPLPFFPTPLRLHPPSRCSPALILPPLLTVL